MVLKKVDNRIRIAIENGVQQKHRTLFFVVGDKCRDQVVILHHMLSKSQVRARPSVLWCYKKELGFSSHRKKRMKQLQKKAKSGSLDLNKDDPFELFIAATTIRYCYYGETHKVLGNTFGMLILQDFEALQPNLLARTIETIEGGGLVCVLLQSMDSLKQLYTMSMDVHARYRTEAHQDVVGRFNERFILSLSSCKNCLVIDDQLRILPISAQAHSISALTPKSKDELLPNEVELKELKSSLQDTQPVGSIINQCKTLDQAKAVLKFIEVISEKTLRSTVALTAARGRGKSAAIGLALASAVAFGYSNIFVTSPDPENLKTLFEFIFKGFDALDYQEHIDYEIIQSTNPDFNKAIVRVNIFRDHRQTIQYISPTDHHKLGQAELVAIDEAAAIPLPYVKELLGPYLVFMSSTINGYEGTGRSLSLKLIEQLRQQSVASQATTTTTTTTTTVPASRMLVELSLNESIRYAVEDPVEIWLNKLLCLDVTIVPSINSGCPLPENCDLYYINRDALFSYHKASEMFLQRIMSLYVASHYKNSPNDLQLMSDAPAHHLFCLLGPVDSEQSTLPEVLCVVQVCLEGAISKGVMTNSLSRGKRGAGDLIPWTVSQQFNDYEFGTLSGARIVRIATHPEFQKMGYGKRAIGQLIDYYSGSVPNLDEEEVRGNDDEEEDDDNVSGGLLEETVKPKKNLPPLLLKLSERRAEKLDYVGVSYGLTPELLRFWKRSDFVPVYLRQSQNEVTGEHTCIMLRLLLEQSESLRQSWLHQYWTDFQRRFTSLLSYDFKKFPASLGLGVLQQKHMKAKEGGEGSVGDSLLTKDELRHSFTSYDLKRLEMYSQNMADYHLIVDLLPEVARLFYLGKLDMKMSLAQNVILMGLGLQRKSVDIMEKELQLSASHILGLFNKIIRKVVQFLNGLVAADIEKSLLPTQDAVGSVVQNMEPVVQTLSKELNEAEKEFKEKAKEKKSKMKNLDLSQFEITGTTDEWDEAIGKTKSLNAVSIPSSKEKLEKRKTTVSVEENEENPKKKKKKKVKKSRDQNV